MSLRVLLSLFAVVCLLACAGGRGERAVDLPRSEVGGPLAPLELVDSRGLAFRAAEHRGEVLVLTFWCTSCDSCRSVEHDLDALRAAFDGQGVRVLAVDSNHPDTAERVNAFLGEHHLGLRVLLDPDGAVARSLGAVLTTTTAVVDANGVVRYFGGFHGAERAIDEVLAGLDVTEPRSRSYG